MIYSFRCFTVMALVYSLVSVVYAQDLPQKASEYCSYKKRNNPNPLAGLEMSPNTPRHSFDVLNYKLNVDLYSCFVTPYPKSYIATNTVTFRVDSALQSIQLNAVNSSLTIDSVRLAGFSFTHASNILTINLDRAYNPNDTVAVKIFYRHNNVADQAFYTYQGMVFTDCEPEGARKWYPCWDRPSDKATLDLTAKMPRTVKFGSNGRLADSTQVADTVWHQWISRDPISTYLVVMTGKVNYNLDIVYWHPPTHPADSVAMRFYWNSGESISGVKQSILPMTTRYSELFGEHPFEKNGFAAIAANAGFSWGGMENQTLTSFCPGCWGDNLMSHEFAHQWFGDMITCGTWADIWLNEGFATYCEALWYEATGGYSSYKSDILSDASGYLGSNPGWAIYNPAWAVTTPDVNTLFNTAITYYKGACVLHMLRYTLGDSLFFSAIKSYATDAANFKLRNAVTADFVAKINQVTGQDLNWFFNQWIYQPNHPTYQNTYNFTSLGNGNWLVGFKAKQTQTNPAFFQMPLELKISFATGADTLIRVMNTVNGQVFAFRFGRQPTALAFDPNNNIVLKQNTSTTLVGPTLVASTLVSPTNGSTKQARSPFLSWNTNTSAAAYHVQLSTDSLFNVIVFDDSTLTDTSRQVGPLQSLTLYYWRTNAKNSAGTTAWSPKWSFTTSPFTDVVDHAGTPREFGMSQNYPNPFNPVTTIRYDIPVQTHVRLTVYTILGSEVANLVNEELAGGTYTAQFDGSKYSSGVYFYKIEAGNFVQTKSLILIK